jgi:hemoglobin
MKTDINGREDILRVAECFYKKVRNDDLLALFFAHVPDEDLPKHIAAMSDFWDNFLFHSGNYSGNPIETLSKLHAKYSFSEEHFGRWEKILNECVDELYAGTHAEMLKMRVSGVAGVMRVKILGRKKK